MSGSTIGGVVGGVIGFWIGGPAGAQVGWMIGSAAGGYLDPTVIKGPRLTDAQAQTAQEGIMRPFGYGTFVCAGNIIQCGPLSETKHRERVGKGSGQVQETYTYSRTFAIRICEGPIGGILRIWMDDKLMYDARDPAEWPDAAEAINNMAADTAKFATAFVFYTGDETQQADPTLQSLPAEYGGGYGNVPSYRGTSYIVFPNFDLTDRQGSVPQFRFEVAVCGDTTTTENPNTWVHGVTGSAQTIFSVAADGLVCMTAGSNNNLRRSLDGGATWNAVDYLTSTGWSAVNAILGVWSTGGAWYIAKSTSIARAAGFGSFQVVLTPIHTIESSGVFLINGAPWAGVNAASHTSIFQPLSSSDTTIDLGGAYGSVTAIGDIGGRMVVGCSDGSVRTTAGTVLVPVGTGTVTKFAYGNGIGIASKAGGYLRTTDGGDTWTVHGIGTVEDVTFCKALGKFFYVSTTTIFSSRDGLTWDTEDQIVLSNGANAFITSDGTTVFATTSDGSTSAMATAYNLPDIASGWTVDLDGTVRGVTNTVTSKCTATLEAIVTDLCGRAGLAASQFDFSALTDEVRGFLVGRQMPAADAIRSLQGAFFFDMPEWGDYTDANTKLRAVKRGGPALFELTDDDLLWSDDDEDTRQQALEFPRKINVVTADVNADYNPVKQSAERQTQDVRAVGETTVELPLSANRDETAQIADKMLRVAWTEAEGRWQRELPEELTVLTPSDPFKHGNKRWRAERVEVGPGSVKVEAVRDRVSAYQSNLAGSTPIAPTPPPLRSRGPTVLAAMNLPQLVTQQNTPGMEVAVCGLLDGWVGCDLQLSVDDGETFQTVARITRESTMGDLTADCGTTGTIAIRLYHGHTMDSVTATQIAARANAWAITSGYTSEVGQTETVTETGDLADTLHTFDLTDNLRGQQGTGASTHVLGDRFVLLDGNTTFIPISADFAGRLLMFRPVSLGTVPENNKTYSVLYSPLFTSATDVEFIVTDTGENISCDDGSFMQAIS